MRAQLGGAGASAAEPGGEEPTRAIAPTESLLRAIAQTKEPPAATGGHVERDSQILDSIKQRHASLIGLVVIACVIGGIVWLQSRPVDVAPMVRTPSSDRIVKPIPMPKLDVAAEPVPPLRPAQKPKPDPTPKPDPMPKPDPTLTPNPMPTPTPNPMPKPDPTPKPTLKPTPTPKLVPAPAGGLPHKSRASDSRASDEPALTPEPEAAPERSEAAAKLDADNVRFVVQAHIAQVHACYSRAFKDSSPGGRVDIGFVIGANGRASRIRTESNSTPSPGLGKCLEQRIADWEFAHPTDGELELVYPFVFSPGT